MYGLRRQLADHVPGDTEAIVTITGADGRSFGELKLDADDVQRLTKAISELIDTDFGQFERAEVQRLLAEHDNR
ncbi:hypothetical protein FB558_6368 [Pseudonocardia kunmingensis]|uniref:Uncharacterized protein n=2 Tax=Pseudonocardia kunmingensis TaxID=630975 RepID=A0A543D9V2_9PSEU|nr:hypothetical protein FB558_6368 [Pseudonocardia kunmingensis]